MTLSITHTTPADATFSTAGATAWNATHSLGGVADISQGGTNATTAGDALTNLGAQPAFSSQTANYVYAAPNGSAGSPTFRALVAADVPTLNQNTTGTAANVTGIVAIANGGTGSSTAATARTALGLGTIATQAANNVAITGGAISGTTITALDNALTLQNSADTTKQSTFSLALITTGTSVVYTMPAVTGTIAALNGTNVWTANNVFSAVNGTFGSSGAAGTIQVAAGPTVSGSTKTVNIGTGGVSGSTTNITVGTNVSGSTSTTTMNGVVKRQVYTVATLPSASTSGLGATAFVSDALAPAFGATVVTGGAVAVPVYSDGTNWKVC